MEQSAPLSRLPVATVVAAVAATAIAPLIYLGWVRIIGADQLVPTVLMGVIVGLAVRFSSRGVSGPILGLTLVLAAIATIAGFFVGDYLIWTPFMPGETVRRMLNLIGLITIAGSLYFAYLLASAGRPRLD